MAAHDSEDETSYYRSPLIGGLNPQRPAARRAARAKPTPATTESQVPVLVELNVRYRGGLLEVTEDFFALWQDYPTWAGAPLPEQQGNDVGPGGQPVPPGLRRITNKLYQCQLSPVQLQSLVDHDRDVHDAEHVGAPSVIFKIWPDYTLYPQIDRSAPTVKASAAWRSYDARGAGVVWAVIDSGIDAAHPHFAALELAKDGQQSPTAGLHRDFTSLVILAGNPPADPESPLTDAQGHGSHVAGIISGHSPDGSAPHVATSDEPPAGAGFVQRARVSVLSGMAPACELISLKVMRLNPAGVWITSSAAVIAALDYLRTTVNVDPAVLRVHGVNLSLGCTWDPTHYAAGQSPLSQAVNQLADSGVVVVVSAGNGGSSQAQGPAASTALLGSITEPAHAEDCIAVGSTHREAPHVFGISWTSGKGPTLDGRLKPDVVAPGEWITSAATGELRARAGLDSLTAKDGDPLLTYAEQSGTSMAAPHVSGILAAFLSARPEYIGRPREVKRALKDSATDLGRERYAQGAGLVDLMRMLGNA